jgi:hypothetical protein
MTYSSYSFSTFELDGMTGQRHAPAALYPRGKKPRYTLYKGWGRVGPRVGLDTGATGKILLPCRESNPDHSVRSQTLY